MFRSIFILSLYALSQEIIAYFICIQQLAYSLKQNTQESIKKAFSSIL